MTGEYHTRTLRGMFRSTRNYNNDFQTIPPCGDRATRTIHVR